ncbi:TraR/DksA C4-type zinc finger protein [Amphritea sp.]|uniref:TraR/DksA family transcriptional regulator n=1 Tax=Amphritea sp. TaxID=1872502 RepID=UPI0025BCE5B3|nr:TraR/DksA C4-type zinc finger protein [Amphritea sp.]
MKPCCLSDSQLSTLKREVQSLEEQLQADLEAEQSDKKAELSLVASSEVLDRAEAVNVAVGQQTVLSHIVQLEEEIIECRNALQRIEDGRYGCCGSCDEEIELNRLMANPVAILCVGCQSQYELHRTDNKAASF